MCTVVRWEGTKEERDRQIADLLLKRSELKERSVLPVEATGRAGANQGVVRDKREAENAKNELLREIGSNGKIAAQFGCSRETVRRIALKIGTMREMARIGAVVAKPVKVDKIAEIRTKSPGEFAYICRCILEGVPGTASREYWSERRIQELVNRRLRLTGKDRISRRDAARLHEQCEQIKSQR